MSTLSAPFWCLCQKLPLSPLYFNKTLLPQISERSSLVSGPGLNLSPAEAKNPGVLLFSNSLSWTYLLGSIGYTGTVSRLVDTVGEEEDAANWENIIETYTLPCKITSENLLCDSNLVLCDNVEGWDRVGGSRGRGHMYTYGWFMLMYGKNQHNIVKQLSNWKK